MDQGQVIAGGEGQQRSKGFHGGPVSKLEIQINHG